MNRKILLLLAALSTFPNLGHAAERPANEQPMYGNAKRAPIEKNEEFSNIAVDRGWQALARNDLSTAIKRFNQGWLLNRDNGRTYWGFAVIMQLRDQNTAGAIEMFERARKLLPNDPALLLDYGRILEGGGQYHEAIKNFKAALALDENIPPAYYGLVRAYLGLKDIRTAAHYAKVGKKFGIPLSDREIDDLQQLAKTQRE